VNRNRLLISATLVVTLFLLLAWQQQRHNIVAACQDKGGQWNGSSCRPDPGRIIIQRDLRRS
jgi:hypothetical protein